MPLYFVFIKYAALKSVYASMNKAKFQWNGLRILPLFMKVVFLSRIWKKNTFMSFSNTWFSFLVSKKANYPMGLKFIFHTDFFSFTFEMWTISSFVVCCLFVFLFSFFFSNFFFLVSCFYCSIYIYMSMLLYVFIHSNNNNQKKIINSTIQNVRIHVNKKNCNFSRK